MNVLYGHRGRRGVIVLGLLAGRVVDLASFSSSLKLRNIVNARTGNCSFCVCKLSVASLYSISYPHDLWFPAMERVRKEDG